MKKLSCMVLILSVVILIVSCEAQSNHEHNNVGAYLTDLASIQYGSSESGNLHVDHRKEIDLNKHRYEDHETDASVTVVVDGESYVMEYVDSERGAYYRDELHRYSVDTEFGKCYADFDAVTGEMVSWVGVPVAVEDNETALTQEQQYEIAYQFLAEHVSNPEEYELVWQAGETIYYAWFARVIDEIETYERVKVCVDQTGHIVSYFLEHVDELSAVKSVPTSIIEMAYDELEYRGNEIYSGLGEGYSNTLSTGIDRLIRLDDGSLALDCHIIVQVTTPEGIKLSDGAWFIIPITEPTQ